MNLTDGIQESYQLRNFILAETSNSNDVFYHRAESCNRKIEWTLCVNKLCDIMEQALERCPDDVLISCIVYSLANNSWNLDLHAVPQDWSTNGDWAYDVWLQQEDPDYFANTRDFFSESDFDVGHSRRIRRCHLDARTGDWDHNAAVVNQWFHSVIERGEDAMRASALARLSVR